MTSVIHIKDTPPGFKAKGPHPHTDYVYIGRPSKWGNPFNVSLGRSMCIELYRDYITSRPELMADLHELKGKTLVCYCKPQACHGDVLAELAEEV